MENKYGGKRAGAGRHKKFDEKSKTISFRCPASREREAKQMIAEWLASLTEAVSH